MENYLRYKYHIINGLIIVVVKNYKQYIIIMKMNVLIVILYNYKI